jgi:hypothetical protein
LISTTYLLEDRLLVDRDRSVQEAHCGDGLAEHEEHKHSVVERGGVVARLGGRPVEPGVFALDGLVEPHVVLRRQRGRAGGVHLSDHVQLLDTAVQSGDDLLRAALGSAALREEVMAQQHGRLGRRQ